MYKSNGQKFLFLFLFKKNVINFNEKTYLKYSEIYVVLISITKKKFIKNNHCNSFK